jgi:hypothetical protein
MATERQIIANLRNAQKSSGPTSAVGREISSQNRFKHGFRGAFRLMENESEADFVQLVNDLQSEHNPTTPTEQLLVQKMAEHHWLTRRARFFQDTTQMNAELFNPAYLQLYMRYETQHERAFFKCLRELQTLRAERRKAEIGFERQKLAEAAETRAQEAHEVKQKVMTARLPLEFPIPDTLKLTPAEIKQAVRTAVSALVQQKAAA